MYPRILIASIVLCLTLLAGTNILPGIAAEPANGQAPTPTANRSASVSLTNLSDAEAAKLSPMKREMREILLLEMTEVEALTARLATIDDRRAALDIQRTIGDRKTKTQIDLLEVQGRFAREEGRIDQADKAEAAAKRLKALLKDRQDSRHVEREDG